MRFEDLRNDSDGVIGIVLFKNWFFVNYEILTNQTSAVRERDPSIAEFINDVGNGTACIQHNVTVGGLHDPREQQTYSDQRSQIY
jgi:hypothetical protein